MLLLRCVRFFLSLFISDASDSIVMCKKRETLSTHSHTNSKFNLIFIVKQKKARNGTTVMGFHDNKDDDDDDDEGLT